MPRFARLSLVVLSPILLPLVGPVAQAAPQPAAELTKLDFLLGHWQGGGEAVGEPGGSASPWTGTVSFRKVLGGHFIEEVGVIEVGLPEPMVFRNHYGYDATTGRFMTYGVTNMGRLTAIECIVSGKSIVSSDSSNAMGVYGVEQWTMNVSGDSYTLRGVRAMDGGDFEDYVTGTMKREAAGPESVPDVAFPVMPVPAEMAAWKGAYGEYAGTGWMIMPGQPKMEIQGDEVLRSLFGGMAVESVVHGQPGNYESWGAIGWDPELKCYVAVGLNNMGEQHVAHGWMVDGHAVFTSAQPMAGIPTAMRTVMERDDSGQIVAMRGHSMSGVDDPHQSFEMTYKRKSKGQ